MLTVDSVRDRIIPGRSARWLSGIVVLLLITSSLLFLLSGTVSAASIIEVDDDAPGWYDATHVATITEAVNIANTGDTILVHAGTYNEAVTVDISVSIIGVASEPGAKIVQASGYDVINIAANNVKITGLTVRNGIAGIAITGAVGSRIEGCNLTNNNRGVSIAGSFPTNNAILNCTFDGNSMSGVYGDHAFDLRLSGNTIQNTGSSSEKSGVCINGGQDVVIANCSVVGSSVTGVNLTSVNGARLENNTVSGNDQEGVLLKNSQDVVMRDNAMTGNKYDLSVEAQYDHDISQSNTVSGGKVYYYSSMTGLTVPSDAGYVGLYQCSDITVEDLTISKVGQGVLLADSFDILISHVTTQDCLVGIDMSGSYSSSVEHCLIDHSYNHGIKIYQVGMGFGGNHIENTTVKGTYSPVLGSNILLSSSSNNEIYDCNVSGSVGIGVQVTDSSDCAVVRTTISGSQQGAGLQMDTSPDCTLSNNIVVNNFNGIQVVGSTNVLIIDNQVQDNDIGNGDGEGISLETSPQSNVLNNLVIGNKRGINIESSNDCNVENNSVANHGEWGGIRIRASSSANVINNVLSNNEYGIEVSGSTAGSPNLDMIIMNNDMQDSTKEGLFIINTVTNAQIHGNTITDVGFQYNCIYMGPQTGQSLIYDNSFTGENNANDAGSQNRWNITKTAGTNVLGGVWLAGNYYSNNTDAVDANMDGICDSSYQLGGIGKIDYLPLFKVEQPSAPRNLTVNAGDGQVTLSWEAPESDGGWPIIGYEVYRGTTPSNIVLYMSLGGIFEFTDTNVTNMKAYFYQVAGVNTDRLGDRSSIVPALPSVAPLAPTLVAMAGNGYVNLSWWPPVNGGSPINSYFVYRGGSPIVLLVKVPSTQLYYNDTAVTNRVTYTYQVSANNSAGEGLRSGPVTAQPNWPASMPIVNITAPSTQFQKVDMVDVEWEMSDIGSGIDYCEIRLDALGWINLSLAQSYSFNNLGEGPHVVEVRAWNIAGYSNNSSRSFVVDSLAPVVVWTYPNGTAAPVTMNVTIAFSEDMANATATIDGQNMTVTIVGDEVRGMIPFSIDLDTTYMVMVMGSDLAGNQMDAPFFFNYTTTDKVKVTGRVMDSDGKNVANAQVNIGGFVTTSDPQGNFTLYVPPGTHNITIEADGLDPYINQVTVNSNGGDLGPFLTAGTQDKEDDTNWLMLIGGLAGLTAGIVLLAFVLRMRKGTKKGDEKPPVQ